MHITRVQGRVKIFRIIGPWLSLYDLTLMKKISNFRVQVCMGAVVTLAPRLFESLDDNTVSQVLPQGVGLSLG